MLDLTLSRRSFLAMASTLAIGAGLVGSASQLAIAAFADEPLAFEGGDGTPESPYEIATAEQLAAIANDPAACYVLVDDIDLAGVAWEPVCTVRYSTDFDMETGEMDMTKVFVGVLDGAGHTISGLSLESDGDHLACGLIGCSMGEVRDLVVEGAVVDSQLSAMATGVVVGYGLGGLVEGVSTVACTVSGTNCVGGVVGGSMCEIAGCKATDVTVNVLGDNDFSDGRIIQYDSAECGGLIVGGGFSGSVHDCEATGTVIAEGNEPVGLGGIGGCLQCMPEIANNKVSVRIEAGNGHAIGGLCGYAGMGDDGDGVVDEPALIRDCEVEVEIVADGATHVGGIVGTGLYYYGMEDCFEIDSSCKVSGTIDGAVTPGVVAGRAEGSIIGEVEYDVLIDGDASDELVGTTDKMYESGDQYEDEGEAEPESEAADADAAESEAADAA